MTRTIQTVPTRPIRGFGRVVTTLVIGAAGKQPLVSNVNLIPGEVRPNLAIVPLTHSAGGKDGINIYASDGPTDVIVDVVGLLHQQTSLNDAVYDGRIASHFPVRAYDTRTRDSMQPLPEGEPVVFTDKGLESSYGPVRGELLNVTATQAKADTYITMYPDGVGQPNASNLNVLAGQDIPNGVLLAVSPANLYQIYNNAGTTHLILDSSAVVLADDGSLYAAGFGSTTALDRSVLVRRSDDARPVQAVVTQGKVTAS
jgi:hypothetical protein